MPWGRRYYYRRRRYPRRNWRRRYRRPIFKRYWRRRHWVRKRHFKLKLKRLHLTQWQPPSIRKLTVKGTYPLFACTSSRLSNNLITWLESIAPQWVPGGGGFSIACFSLNTLYKEHLKLHNWWTHTNDNYPLIRYSGATITLYKPENVDYMFYYQTHYPMQATQLMYTSTHPSIMLLNNRKRTIKCKASNKKTKPYIKLRIPPPTQMSNKWYFQKDIADLPLLLTIATVCSLDRPYQSSSAISTTMGFTSLNWEAFQNRSFSKIPTDGYHPKPQTRYFVTQDHSTDPTKVKIGSLIYLGNTNDFREGYTIEHEFPTPSTANPYGDQLKLYLTQKEHWGNPFHPTWLSDDYNIWETNKSTQEIIEHYKQNSDPLLKDNKVFFTKKDIPLTFRCRYNPFHDDNNNDCYILKISDFTPQFDWHEPPNDKLVSKNLPLWACLWGYADFQKKQAVYNNIDTETVLVIVSHSLDPKTSTIFIPLDQDFLNSKSPYRPQTGDIIPSDRQNWHPKFSFQQQTTNNIACSGPYTAKLPKQQSCEGHMSYKFRFKLGGSPPPMATLTNPSNQPKYITPDNFLRTTSLQSPTLPFENYLYHFDERRQQITKKAIKRMQTDQQTESSLLQITAPTSTDIGPPIQTPETSETEDSEKETETLEQQLLRQRKCQKQLRHRINQLLNRLTSI